MLDFDERLYQMVEESQEDNTAAALMGLLNINVMGVSYRYRKDMKTPQGTGEYMETIYNIDYQRPDGKWAHFVLETMCDSESAPAFIVNEVRLMRETQAKVLKALERE